MEDQLSILLVDDDALDRMAVRRALRSARLSYRAEEASDRESALAALAVSAFDVVLLDYYLPGIDGMGMLQELRRHQFAMPVIMLTGQGDEQLAIELLRAGATDYLSKNAVSPDVLAQSIRRAVRIHRAERVAAQAEQALLDAAERQRFLAEASQRLVESLDTPIILDRLVQLATQSLADGCAVDMLEENQLSRAAAHANDKASLWAALLLAPLPYEDDHVGPRAVVANGMSQVFANLEAADDQAKAGFLKPFLAAGIRAIMLVPLMVRNQIMGVLTFVRAERMPPYTNDDALLAEDLVHRAAVALDNARLYREAQDAVQVRDAFLSVAAHELKTPLTTLYGNVQLLQRRAEREHSLNERDQRTLRIIYEQTSRLNRMITALLDLSRLQMGQFTIEPEQIDLAALALRVVDELHVTSQYRLVVTGAEAPIPVLADELRLEQVLQNLIQNAIKYSPNGGEIGVRLAQNQGFAEIAISDHGIGIPKASIPSLFRRFFRAANARAQRISGIGVGLFVVNQIITLHGGQVEVDSTEGVGTTFTIRLPQPE